MNIPPTKKTNLFVVGAMKSGTTSLHNYLNSHPSIFMSHEKEPGYFVDQLNWRRGISWYNHLFDDANPIEHQFVGESSTHYAKQPLYNDVPKKIFDYNANAHIIYIMRDPLQRTISHYWHEVRQTYKNGLRSNIIDACKQDYGLIEYSDYAMQIEPYLALFGKDRVHLVIFEDLKAAPNIVLNKLFSRLNVPSYELEKEGTPEVFNKKPNTIIGVSGSGVLNRISHSRLWEKISPQAPQVFKNLAKTLALKKVDTRAQDKFIPELRDTYRTRFINTREKISELTSTNLLKTWKL